MNAITTTDTAEFFQARVTRQQPSPAEADRIGREIMEWEDGRRAEAGRLLHAYLIARSNAAGVRFDQDAILADACPCAAGYVPRKSQSVTWVSTVDPATFWPRQAALPSAEADYLISKVIEVSDDETYSLLGVTVYIGPFWIEFTDDWAPSRGFLRRWMKKHQKD